MKKIQQTQQISNNTHNHQSNQLQISNFIKQPQNLKLLILAGTQLQLTQFATIRKCLNLIKLDLSNNGLKTIPIGFHQFKALKILFLHDNSFQNIDALNAKDSSVQYLTLFGNPIKKYRRYLINHLPKLKGIDFNMVSQYQRYHGHIKQEKTGWIHNHQTNINNTSNYNNNNSGLPAYTQLKWPIVELEKGLQNEIDYLNLLKAEIFVLNNVYLKSHFTEVMERFLSSLPRIARLQAYQIKIQQKQKKHNLLIRKCVQKWRRFISKRKVLRQFLQRNEKQYLMYNTIQYKKYLRSKEANDVISRYVDHIRKNVKVQKILRHNIVYYARMLSTQIMLTKNIIQTTQNIKFYFSKSQIPVFQKLCLYTKKLLFNSRKYDLCDSFNQILKPTGKQYLILRSKSENIRRKSYLLQMISKSMHLVLISTHQSNSNYIKKKKRLIKIKPPNLINSKLKLSEKQFANFLQASNKLQLQYFKYEKLQQYQCSNPQIYTILMRLLRWFNAGNQMRILGNVAAYFQTQIPQQQQSIVEQSCLPFLRKRVYLFNQQMIKRALASVKIQKFWRKYITLKKSKINIIKIINEDRAARLIQKWSRNLIFSHRMNFKKKLPFYEKSIRSQNLYMQLFIYMGLPQSSNLLRIHQRANFQAQSHERQFKDLYQLIHKNTKTKIIWIAGVKWIKIQFASISQAIFRSKMLATTTYKMYYNGHYIRMFNLENCTDDHLSYYNQLLKSYKLRGPPAIQLKTQTKNIDNELSIFIMQKGNPNLLAKVSKLAHTTLKNIRVNMFVINQGKRPLKVQCQLNVIIHNNIHLQNHLPKQFTIRHSLKIGSNNSEIQKFPSSPYPIDLQQFYIPKPHNFGSSKLKQIQRHNINRRDSMRHSSVHQSPNKQNHNNSAMISSIRLISETIPFKRK